MKRLGIIILAMAMLAPTASEIASAATLPQSPDASSVSADKNPSSNASENSSDTIDQEVYLDAEVLVKDPGSDEPLTEVTSKDYPYGLDGKRIFNPSPTRAVWMSALFPGLGQIYNRRYWKLPIIAAGFMGLAYGTSWNARMFQDYQTAYADAMDDDPDTDSYKDFFPPNYDMSKVNESWLKQVLKSRKDYYRRNRDLCIICCVGLYLLCMLDAYVDAQLTHFDVSDNVSMDVTPSMLFNPGGKRPTLALNWALTF